MREKHLLQDRIELLGAVRHSDVLSVSARSVQASYLTKNLDQGLVPRIHFYEHVLDRILWNRHSGSGMCRSIRRIDQSRRRTRNLATRHDQFRRPRSRRYVQYLLETRTNVS